MRIARIGLVAAGLAAAMAGWAQQAGVYPQIEAKGAATVEADPDIVDFWIHFEISGESFAEAGAGVKAAEQRLHATLDELKLTPMQVTLSAPSVPDVTQHEMHITAMLRYSATVFFNTEKGLAQFAELCDTNRGLAEQVEGTIEGPHFSVKNPEQVERAAIQKAMEEAYPKAQAAAEAMRSSITSVARVRVDEITWNNDPEWRGMQPEITRVTCTASIEIAYIYAGQL